MDILTAAIMGLVLFIPALVPNSAAALFGGGTPVDFNRAWRGKRLLGDGKTWRGLFGGVGFGILVGLLMLAIAYLVGSEDGFGYGQFPDSVGVVVCLALGSLLGDMTGRSSSAVWEWRAVRRPPGWTSTTSWRERSC